MNGNSKKIVINDYCGHPFQIDLSKELARRSYKVLHLYTSASGGPKSIPNVNEYSDLIIKDIVIPEISKQNFFRRWWQERLYGVRVVEELKKFSPDIMISANTPLSALRLIKSFSESNDIKFVFWLQDIISVAVNSILGKRFGILGKIIGYVFKKIEYNILSNSDKIITIADEFIETIELWGIDTKKAITIPNWAPIEQMPIISKENTFSRKYGIENKFVIMYSGTLGLKHNPYLISQTAKRLLTNNEIIFVVITDGIGREILEKEKKQKDLKNLLLLNFQPPEEFSNVLAASDILLTILEKEAGIYSVPSKVWSGYCAGKPSLLIMPHENLAAKRTIEVNAGFVIANDDADNLDKKILELKNNPKLCQSLGANGRMFAEKNFKISTIGNKFDDIINSILS
mgnify:CR=1 FL=1|tara:strand:+ start:1230 stop:2432 length:1203 start_codon:yes stop_codon:yes gene_type:complete